MRVLLAFIALLSLVCGRELYSAPSPPVFPGSYWVNETMHLVQAQGPPESSYGYSSYQQDSVANRTSWIGGGNNFVADFDQQIVFYIDYYGVCQYTCALQQDTACNSQLNGDSLCTYDYTHYAKYVDDEEIDGQMTNKFFYVDPLGSMNITMATHTIYTVEDQPIPVRMFAEFTPFGNWAANVTIDFTNFNAGTPPEENFAVKNTQYCQDGGDACQNNAKLVYGHLKHLNLLKFYANQPRVQQN